MIQYPVTTFLLNLIVTYRNKTIRPKRQANHSKLQSEQTLGQVGQARFYYCHPVGTMKNLGVGAVGHKYSIKQFNTFKTLKKCHEIQLKNKMDLEQIEKEKHKSLARART